MCRQHQRGECSYGELCKHAHDVTQLHPFSPENPANKDYQKTEKNSEPDNSASSMPGFPLMTGQLAEQQQAKLDAKPQMRIQRRQSMCNRYKKEGCLLNER